MKKTAAAFIAFLLLLLLPRAQAQLVPEHIYTGDLLQRIKLEESGGKYLLRGMYNSYLRLFNASHTAWKTYKSGLWKCALAAYIRNPHRPRYSPGSLLYRLQQYPAAYRRLGT